MTWVSHARHGLGASMPTSLPPFYRRKDSEGLPRTPHSVGQGAGRRTWSLPSMPWHSVISLPLFAPGWHARQHCLPPAFRNGGRSALRTRQRRAKQRYLGRGRQQALTDGLLQKGETKDTTRQKLTATGRTNTGQDHGTPTRFHVRVAHAALTYSDTYTAHLTPL